MFQSSVDFLNELIASKSNKRASLGYSELEDETIVEKEKLSYRFGLIHAYFLRMSTQRKMKFLQDLLERMTQIDSLNILVDAFYSFFDKLYGYSKTIQDTKYMFDVSLQDHDRMLDKKCLDESIEADLVWISTLTDSEKISLFISLFRNSGGAVMRDSYMALLRIYHKRRKLQQVNNVRSSEKEQTKNDFKELDIEEKLESIHDIENPHYKEYLAKKKIYDDSIAKYKKELGIDDVKVIKVKQKKKKKNEKIKKKNNKKKKHDTNSNKKSNKKKKKNTQYKSIDLIQMLPIWIIKKILSYLDKKSLANLKKVDEYWEWAVGDFLKDTKTQKFIDKTIKKIQDITAIEFEDSELHKSPQKSIKDKRMAKLYKRGAILEPMRHTKSRRMNHNCLLLSAISSTPNEYIEPIEEVSVFPRVEPKKIRIYKRPTHIIKDLNLIYETHRSDDDITSPRIDFSLATTDTKTSMKTDESDRFT